MEALPAVGDDRINPQEPCGEDGECTHEDYKGWWDRGEELYQYLDRLPEKYSKEFGMAGLHRALVRRWHDEVQGLDSVGEFVPSATLGTLLLWIRQTETLIYYVTYQDQESAVPGPTTPGLLKIVDEPKATAWQWPWIQGWDDPEQRSIILDPSGGGKKKWSTMKKVLVVGGISAAALLAGKRMISNY